MDKRRIIRKPYSFRGRMIAALMIGSLLATVISLFLAFCVTHINLLQELKVRERAVAIYLMELEQRTELRTDELARLMEQNGIEVAVLSDEDVAALSAGTQRELKRAGIAYESTTWKSQRNPVTYVQMRTGVLAITAGGDGSSYGIAFARIIFGSTSFLAVFALMVTLASYWISKPVHEITNATRKVKEGDFTVKLDAAHAPGEIGELMRSFNAMTDALSRTSYLQKDFISSISHEFKTPIASIRGFARLLQMPGLTEAQRQEYVDLIAQESDRLSRLSQTLLRLSALEQQSAPASLTEFSLDEQLRQVILRLEPTWSARGISWQLDLNSVTVVSDEELLSHVWMNIIQNAIKFSPENAVIEVRVFATDTATVEITDHGIGMDDATVKRIFDRFYQADRSRKQEGVGFGRLPDLILLDGGRGHVAAVKPLVRQMGFDIPIFGMAKDDRHRTRALVTAAGDEIAISAVPSVFALIGTIQEETHRFAITYQRTLRSRRMKASGLEDIPGIGEKRRQALLKKFRSVKAISQAGQAELEQVLPVPAAQAVYRHFHPQEGGTACASSQEPPEASR